MLAKNMTKLAMLTLLAALALGAGGCAASYTATQYQHLDVQTQISNTVFLTPMPPAQRTVYVEVRNAADQSGFNLAPDIKAALSAKGYRVVDDPSQAWYRLQAIVLHVGMGNFNALQNAPGMAQGGMLAGAAAGAVLGGNRPMAGAVIGALAMGLAETVTGATTQVITYGVTADIQIAEMVRGYESYGEQGLRRHYLRATTTARQLNLPWETAFPYLRSGMVQAITGLF